MMIKITIYLKFKIFIRTIRIINHYNTIRNSMFAQLAFKSSFSCKLGNNNFSGEIPYDLIQLKKLTQISLHNNSFTGSYPKFLENQSQIKDIQLFNNKFTYMGPSS